ncbi:MAG: hypothetical protein NZ843_04335, partial [Fimbriimonadales bacterium]|nr:hypothetical protein [Fimbriimonadales bacterium]
MPRYRWRIRHTDEAKARKIAEELGLSLPTARLLVARGYTEPETAYRFLHPALHDLADPRLLP